jgi:hypothetical protein
MKSICSETVMRMGIAVVLSAGSMLAASSGVRVAPFRADATPPLGAPLIWVTPAARVADPLWAKGLLIESKGKRYVLCAVDWCGIGGAVHDLIRARIAKAAGAETSAVELHVIHQHTAPYLEGDGQNRLAKEQQPPLLYPQSAIEAMADRIAVAVEKARAALQPVDSIGLGQAEVKGVASARRIRLDGKLSTRYSTSGKDPAMAAAPDGPIDPFLKTITFAKGDKPVARLHYYATHPQTFCCEGTISADFVGAARESVEKDEAGVAQIYFTGAAGDVTVGKYNDGTVEKRKQLEERLREGIRASIRATQYQPLQEVSWRAYALRLPPRPADDPVLIAYRAKMLDLKATGNDRLRGAIAVAWSERKRPIQISALYLGPATVVHLPGEPLLEFQKFAQQQRPGQFVAVAGYGDIAPGYVCPDLAHREGGYEPSASNTPPGAEAVLKTAISKLLAK